LPAVEALGVVFDDAFFFFSCDRMVLVLLEGLCLCTGRLRLGDRLLLDLRLDEPFGGKSQEVFVLVMATGEYSFRDESFVKFSVLMIMIRT
jgi:hypothetical protein